jgi:hypothetical protein
VSSSIEISSSVARPGGRASDTFEYLKCWADQGNAAAQALHHAPGEEEPNLPIE